MICFYDLSDESPAMIYKSFHISLLQRVLLELKEIARNIFAELLNEYEIIRKNFH